MKTESKIRNKKYGNCKNSVVVVLIMVIIKMTVVTILMMMMMILDDHRQHYYVCTSVHFGDRYSVNSYRLQNAVDVAFQWHPSLWEEANEGKDNQRSLLLPCDMVSDYCCCSQMNSFFVAPCLPKDFEGNKPTLTNTHSNLIFWTRANAMTQERRNPGQTRQQADKLLHITHTKLFAFKLFTKKKKKKKAFLPANSCLSPHALIKVPFWENFRTRPLQ